MPIRRFPLAKGENYHIFSKSIADFKIFKNKSEYERMRNLCRYYTIDKPPLKFSAFMEIKGKDVLKEEYFTGKEKLVKIIAYCFMPTHIHLILKQLKENGISIYMSNILNSYTHYFNIKHKRRGPLWESRFKNVFISDDEQLLHLTRYVHLNPVTAYLVNTPQDWDFSSYKEFLGRDEEMGMCDFREMLNIDPVGYGEFVISQIDYQRQLQQVKQLFLE